MSELWVNTFKNENGNGAPDFPNGITVTGVVTSTTLNATVSGDLTVTGDIGCAGTITYEDVARVDATGISTFREGFKVGPLTGIALTTYNDGSIRTSGVVTATQFYGGGGNLTGIDATAIQTGNTVVQTNASRIDSKVSNVGILTVTSAGINVTGVVTATSFVGSGANLTGITQTTINNNADDRVITGSGTANTLNGEVNLTFSSSALTVRGGSGDTTINLRRINAAGSNGNTFGNILWSDNNGNTVAQLRANRATAVDDANIVFSTRSTGGSVTERVYINNSGHLTPAANNTYDLGSSALKWRNLYTNDLNLSNEGSSNDVDGTWGDYKIQEGEFDLFLINNRNGKKYKFNLTEVN